MTLDVWTSKARNSPCVFNSSPKVIGHKVKVAPEETDNILQGYMKEVLDLFASGAGQEKEWRQTLCMISWKILDCDLSDETYRTSAGLTLARYANEIRKAIDFLTGSYKGVREEMCKTERPVAIRILEQQLKQILHHVEVALQLHDPAAVMEQKLRSYFIVSVASECLAPLSMHDHEVFDLFCQIYKKTYPDSEHGPQKDSPCTQRLKEAFQFTIFMKQSDARRKLDFASEPSG